MNTTFNKLLSFISLILLSLHFVFSQNNPVVINEIMVSPAGNGSVNCFYNGDTLNGGDPTLGAEWIELYNTDPCHAADISCYILGWETSSGTGQNWGDIHFPGGTIIPPSGHLLIGGSNVSFADFILTINNAAHCSSRIWELKDSAGWVGLYNNSSTPIDAIYWNIGGSASDLNVFSEYTTDLEVNINSCTCCSPGTLLCVNNGSVEEFAGNVIPNSSITFARITDGNPIWGYGPVGGSPDTCNGSNADCYNMQISFTVTPPTCVGGGDGSVNIFTNTNAYPQSPFSYYWSNGDTLQSTTSVSAGTYYITVTDKWGCQYTSDTTLNDPVPPVVSIINNGPVCQGDFLYLSSDIGGLAYNWSGPDGFSSTFPSPVISDFQQSNAGNYVLIMVDSNSCTLQDTVNIQIQPLPIVDLGPDTTICNNISISLDIDNGNNYSYLWNDGTTLPQNTIPSSSSSPGTNPFWVWASATGCKTVTDSMLITLEYCEIEESNVITPNGDNINDVFKINGLEKFPNSELYIFNRWGRKVYESSDYQNNWNGESCPDGVYYYILRIPDGNSNMNEIKGWITIIGKNN